MEVFAGKNGFVWFQGVVEDRADPELLGRVRVRCLGFHTENKEQLPTEDLPWAYPIQPITSAAMNGIGYAPVGPVEGTWVFGFFRDGESAQEPMILGTLGGIPQQKAKPKEGFNDPNGTYPIEELLGEPDTNRLARGVEEQTYVEFKKDPEYIDKMKVAGGIGGDGPEVEEPETPYQAKYPFNHVRFSESGHLEELDDTPGAERMHRYHRSGTFEEIHPDGSKVLKIVNSQYEVILKDNNLHVKGDLNVTVEGKANIYSKGDCIVQTDGNMEQVVAQDLKINAGGQVQISAGDLVTIKGSTIKLN